MNYLSMNYLHEQFDLFSVSCVGSHIILRIQCHGQITNKLVLQIFSDLTLFFKLSVGNNKSQLTCISDHQKHYYLRYPLRKQGRFQKLSQKWVWQRKNLKKTMLDLLDVMIPYGKQLEILNLSNSFVFFHHLMEDQRNRFDWIIYSRINDITYLTRVLLKSLFRSSKKFQNLFWHLCRWHVMTAITKIRFER